ncbi:hypothetical protein KP509_10G014300 [Ceratopteris richardii]|uniref:Uncharacterized protein n=1 Tax=Ceratopteris richardii TaxID=49495 RepID=A0A8T2TV33_CERRI|nr:hypothetical protein KP509_10G014300 [Ceratopteris richardii]
MARSSIRTFSLGFLLRRQLSSSAHSPKFSLVKLQRDEVSTQDLLSPYNRVPEIVEDVVGTQPSAEMHLDTELRAPLNASASAAAAIDKAESQGDCWGPDAATGTWTPFTHSEKMMKTSSSPMSVLSADAHNAGFGKYVVYKLQPPIVLQDPHKRTSALFMYRWSCRIQSKKYPLYSCRRP